MNPTFILIHGAWHGGWCWEEVKSRLNALGFRVLAPSLAGAAERAGEATASTGLMDHVQEVVGLIDATPGEVVLVGHSYGGMVIAGAAARRGERIARLVYLDALAPADGDSVASIAGPEAAAGARAEADANGDGWRIGPGFFPHSKFVDWTGDRLARFSARLTPQPLQTFLQPVTLPAEINAPADYILATEETLGLFEPIAAGRRGRPGWSVYELPTRHDIMLTMPSALAGILAGPWLDDEVSASRDPARS